MEKFSAYRDPGTGIQPFLTPVPPHHPHALSALLLPLRYVLAILRTSIILVLAALYLVLVRGLFLVFYPIPPLYRIIEHITTYILARTALLILGVFWISVEQWNRKRSRGTTPLESWNPKPGDLIVSNWASWIELLWLALRFNPVFVFPVSEHPPDASTDTPASHPTTQAPFRSPVKRVPIRGFLKVSVMEIISLTGKGPLSGHLPRDPVSLDHIRRTTAKPIVVFPECTSSNGRGLLRFASVFHEPVPVKNYQVFVMNVRYDPPETFAPTLTLSIPSKLFNPLPHIFTVATSLVPAQVTIRLLAPSESPGSPLFITSDVLSDYKGDDQLSEACAILTAQMGKMKRTGMGWEDKSKFQTFYNKKHQ